MCLLLSSTQRRIQAQRSDQLLHHETTLKLWLRALGIQQFHGLAATAPDAREFFDKP
jgi:hypothetical protein